MKKLSARCPIIWLLILVIPRLPAVISGWEASDLGMILVPGEADHAIVQFWYHNKDSRQVWIEADPLCCGLEFIEQSALIGSGERQALEVRVPMGSLGARQVRVVCTAYYDDGTLASKELHALLARARYLSVLPVAVSFSDTRSISSAFEAPVWRSPDVEANSIQLVDPLPAGIRARLRRHDDELRLEGYLMPALAGESEALVEMTARTKEGLRLYASCPIRILSNEGQVAPSGP